ncbi:MAG: purine-nucleoside phosphorylase [Pseudomonadota bacterium]
MELKHALGAFKPRTGLILGSGLGALAEAVEPVMTVPYGDLDGFPASGVSGHAGELIAGRLEGEPVLMLSGRSHYYEHGDAAAMRPALTALHDVGIERIVLTNSAGSAEPDMPPGSIMMITDHINFAGANPLIGEPSDARFVGMTSAYDKTMRDGLQESARDLDIDLHQGVYMWFSGPTFETPAEIRMAKAMGAHAVGMSTVPETILARFLGMKVAACSVITNFAAGMTGAELSHAETKEVAPRGGEKLSSLLRHVFAHQRLDADA